MNKPNHKTVISIVSHGQLNLIDNLLTDLSNFNLDRVLIVLTINIPEDEIVLNKFHNLPLTIVRNDRPKGFGDNHNNAFGVRESDFFVVVNPDIRLKFFLLTDIINSFSSGIGACAPIVFSPNGELEDSFRKFPSFCNLFARKFFWNRIPDYKIESKLFDVDWVAGMFVVFSSEAFGRVGGFDTRYYMYMEDADICRRLGKKGWRTVLQPNVCVIHDARRASRHSLRHLSWHMKSAFRFLFIAPME